MRTPKTGLACRCATEQVGYIFQQLLPAITIVPVIALTGIHTVSLQGAMSAGPDRACRMQGRVPLLLLLPQLLLLFVATPPAMADLQTMVPTTKDRLNYIADCVAQAQGCVAPYTNFLGYCTTMTVRGMSCGDAIIIVTQYMDPKQCLQSQNGRYTACLNPFGEASLLGVGIGVAALQQRPGAAVCMLGGPARTKGVV